MERLKQLALSNNDSPEVQRVKLRVQSWFLLNAGVVVLPIAFRILGVAFGKLGFQPLIRLEEIFFFVLFATASALVHLTEFIRRSDVRVDSALWRQTWGILIAVVFLAYIYGVGFAGVGNFTLWQTALVIVFMVVGLAIASNSQMLIVDDAVTRALERRR